MSADLTQLKEIINSSYNESIFNYLSTVSNLTAHMRFISEERNGREVSFHKDKRHENFGDCKTAVIILGAIGSGKSTFANVLYERGVIDSKVPFISEDLIKLKFFNDIQPLKKAYEYAKNCLRLNIDSFVRENRSFVLELVPSDERKIETLQLIKNAGYKISSFCLETKNAEINVSRVQNRLILGADSVYIDKVIDRYYSVEAFLNQIVEISNTVYYIKSIEKGFKLFRYCDSKVNIFFD